MFGLFELDVVAVGRGLTIHVTHSIVSQGSQDDLLRKGSNS
jgi:hypothetical protein